MKTIAITLGDVAGIGPEVVRKAIGSGKINRRFRYEVLLENRAPRVALGRPSRQAGRFALDSLEAGVAGCLRGDYAAVVTAPVSKAGLRLAGFTFPGQTEWLAHRTGARDFAMMLVGGSFRVALVTTHTPLRRVSSLITREAVGRVIGLTHAWLLCLGIRRPRVMVAALNPHGGVPEEQGREEISIIAPAVRTARKRLGDNVTGPHSPDHLFWLVRQGKADAVVCMYHDQGLIPLKMLAFDRGVNVTLGLPIIRTSPDHGTAYDIAGRNRADPRSMIEAVNLAARLAGTHPRGGFHSPT
ncbi:MAG: 4-hydroxythreonine-4-phosphate dehydrogenase PdxA [Verrucomicrobia bacterium]|nr:4-hydroxythreonine-4-phosphate dehydrogenase PdxA [Verrucomicrobiota bacterium]